MNRRDLFRGLAGVAGGLILPPSVADAAESVERRFWALGGMPGREIPAYYDVMADLEWRKEWANWRTMVIAEGEAVIREPYKGYFINVSREAGIVTLDGQPSYSVSVQLDWVE